MSKKLSYEDFLESLRLVPRMVVELIVENNEGGILLRKRDKEPFKGHWHLSGGFLLKGERISSCIERLSQEELDIKLDPDKGEFLGIFENIGGDPRGHLLHYVVRFKLNRIGDGIYFKKLPQNTIPYQRDFLEKLGYVSVEK